MNRPYDIPEDVWDRAADFAHEIGTHSGYGIYGDVVDHQSAMTAVARAILAERERCAQRVLSYAGEAGEQNDPPEIRHLSAIVRAIRVGTPCP